MLFFFLFSFFLLLILGVLIQSTFKQIHSNTFICCFFFFILQLHYIIRLQQHLYIEYNKLAIQSRPAVWLWFKKISDSVFHWWPLGIFYIGGHFMWFNICVECHCGPAVVPSFGYKSDSLSSSLVCSSEDAANMSLKRTQSHTKQSQTTKWLQRTTKRNKTATKSWKNCKEM